ncbi:MAG: hypothetical protein AAB434_06085 [Planctomycetota bacterium]
MSLRTVLLAVGAAAILIGTWVASTRPGSEGRAPAPEGPQAKADPTPASAPSPSLPSPEPVSPAAARMEEITKAVGEAPKEVTLSEGARLVFDSALAAQDLGGSIDLAASVASDPEMRQALLDEVSRRLATAHGELRCRLLAILASLGDPQGFALWKATLESDPDPRCREVLARHPVRQEPFGAQATEAVLGLARTDREAAVRLAAIEGLPAGLSDGRMEVFLAVIAGDPDPVVRRASLAYLSEDARGDMRLKAECERLVGDETQDRQLRLLAGAILRDARPVDPSAPLDPDAKPNETDLDRSLPPTGR